MIVTVRQAYFSRPESEAVRALIMTRALRALSDESGQTVVFVAICMAVIVAFLGLAVDVGRLRLEKQKLQSAADAVALAAGLEIRVCGIVSGCSGMQDAAKSAFVENGYTGSNFFTDCASASGALTLTLNGPPCALGSVAADPNYEKNGYIEVVLTKNVATYFMKVLGFNSFTITARAEAARKPGPCIYALDPNASGAISILAGLGINSQCGIVDESSSPSALSCLIGIAMSAPSVAIHGGAAGLLCTPTANVYTGVSNPTPADPLAYLPKPAVGACGSKVGNQYYGSPTAVNILLGGNYTFNPGVYCGGISITAAVLANITFNPGMYILKQGTGLLGITQGGLNLTISALSSIQGNGVTFYNYGPFGGISITAPAAIGLSNFSLTAPTSGEYGGVLFFQDPGNTSTGTFLVNLLQGNKLEGAIYLPSASVTYGVGAISSAYTILVAKDINFNVAILSQFGDDYSSLQAGSPLNGDADVLVQ